jgi:hypothetical protein
MLNLIWKLYKNAESLWIYLIHTKYLGFSDMFPTQVPMRGFQVLNSIQKIKWYFKPGRGIRYIMARGHISGWSSGQETHLSMLGSLTFSASAQISSSRSLECTHTSTPIQPEQVSGVGPFIKGASVWSLGYPRNGRWVVLGSRGEGDLLRPFDLS